MADIYVRSTDGSDADNGSTWALAKATLAGAAAAAGPGDRVFVSKVHAETQTGAMTIPWAGTAGNPVIVLCVDDTGDPSPPTTLATTATVSTTTNATLTINGFAYHYGITFSAGTTLNASLEMGTSTSAGHALVFRRCNLQIGAGTGTGSRIKTGIVGTASKDTYVEWIDTTVQFANASQGINAAYGRLAWRGALSSVTGGTLPTVLFPLATGVAGQVEVSDADLSALGSGKSLVNAAQNSMCRFHFRNCKLGASVSVLSGTIVGTGGTIVDLDNCDSGGTVTRNETYRYPGSVTTETTKVKTGGATDETTPFSLKMTTLSTGPSFHLPLASPPIDAWGFVTGTTNELTPGNTYTATIDILHDSTTNLTDGEVWVELEYLAGSGAPQGTLLDDRKASVLATAADQAASTATWTTTGITNVNKQKLHVSFVPQLRGPIRARVMLAKSNYTIYVDPVLQVA